MTWPFAWYIAGSLEALRRQLNALAPRRSTASDGGIGDYAHSQRTSDHNPNTYRNQAGERQVCARDFTHDPGGGLDCGSLATRLVASGDNRIKYIIWNRRIWEPGRGWQPYYGDNPHTKHLHLSVKAGPLGDDGRAWNLGATADQGDDDMQLSDQVTLFNGTKVSLNNVLAGVFARLAEQQSLEYPHVKADTPEFVVAIDQNVIQQGRRLTDVENGLAELAAKVSGTDTRVQAIADMCEAILTKLNETPDGGA